MLGLKASPWHHHAHESFKFLNVNNYFNTDVILGYVEVMKTVINRMKRDSKGDELDNFDCQLDCTCVSVSPEAKRGGQLLLELELQAIVSHPVWMLASELQSSARTVSALNH